LLKQIGRLLPLAKGDISTASADVLSLDLIIQHPFFFPGTQDGPGLLQQPCRIRLKSI
jgi:hypothetical protein